MKMDKDLLGILVEDYYTGQFRLAEKIEMRLRLLPVGVCMARVMKAKDKGQD
jgi:hypothetical protein